VRRFVLVLVLLVACGKRGDPHPPVPLIPRATTDLVVAQRGPKLILSWSYPSLTTSGEKLTGIRRVVLYRYVEELPAVQPPRDPKTLLPGDIDTTVPVAIALFAKIPPISPLQFAKLRERFESIEAPDLANATVGSRLTYDDTPSFLSRDGRPVRITYAIVTEGDSATSQPSNVATIVPVEVAVPPAAVQAEAKPEGIVLRWSAPTRAISGNEKPPVLGYNIYRTGSGEDVEDLATPLNTGPVSATTYTDVPAHGAYTYRVTAVSAAGPPRIESDRSEPATATYKDLLPPPTPAGLTALVETKAVRLVWDAVSASDLAGYRVYRREGAGHPPKEASERILFTPQLLTVTNWRDTLPDPGIQYFYEVTAVDQSGNESAAAKTDWVMVPKTP
jgi:hypothetical protein